jgi:hypothetical protein
MNTDNDYAMCVKAIIWIYTSDLLQDTCGGDFAGPYRGCVVNTR